MGAVVPKQYLRLLGRPVIEHTVRRFLEYPRVHGVVAVVRPDDERWAACGLEGELAAVAYLREGTERSDSVRAGLERLGALADPEDFVLVHDAVRPCVCASDLDRLIDEVGDDAVGGLLATPVRDTLKRVLANGARVDATVARQGLWRALTPQMFRLGLLREALGRAASLNRPLTDDASAVEQLGQRPLIVEGRADNLKITLPGDLALAEQVLAASSGAESARQASPAPARRDAEARGT